MGVVSKLLSRSNFHRYAKSLPRRVFDYTASSPIYSVVLQGGLGNRLFQIASIYGLSCSHQSQFVVRNEYCHSNSHSSRTYERFYRPFFSERQYAFEKYVEPQFAALSYREISFRDKNTLFEGFFQSERYFLAVRKKIAKLFGPTRSELREIKQRHGNLEQTIFLHVRLGDYIGNALHEIDLSDYYLDCLEDVHSKFPWARVLVSTDDEDRCMEALPFLKRYDFLKEDDEVMALYTLSRCGLGGICANSTFSWWAAWLNRSPEKQVYLPDTWLNDSRYCQAGIQMGGATVIDLNSLSSRGRPHHFHDRAQGLG